MKNIALIGFMACGKSTLGKILAKEMNFNFIDTDAEIEKYAAKTIPEIFDEHGEKYFRTLEHEVLKKLCSLDHVVLSTGGGIITTPENITLLKEHSFTVFLDVPFEILAQRAGATDNRPLFRDPDAAYALWQKRLELYRSAADYIYDTHEEILLKSARHIMEAYHTHLKKSR